MTPGARIAAAIDLLEKIERSASPADDVISAYHRSRRFIGSTDRREISRHVFTVLRHRARLNWWTRGGDAQASVLAALIFVDGLGRPEITTAFDGRGYNPPALDDGELALTDKMSGQPIDQDDMPAWVRAEVPEWLSDGLSAAWGKKFESEATALNQPAFLDLRVNTLKTDFTRVLEVLKNDGIEADATSYSPIGLRVRKRTNLQSTTAFKGGFVEVQDEGSQLVSLLVGAKADMKTIDFCAGGGGKTLALAAAMKDGGPLIACDLDESRLKRLPARLKRAGVSNVSRRTLSGLDDPWIGESKATAARVLLDVPCSGAGAWRRNPAAKWRLTPARLAGYVAEQQSILAAAAPMVAPGGRLIYATCSVLAEENERQIDWFLGEQADYRLRPVGEVWAETIGSPCPCPGPYLSLTPGGHGTDGFFAAILEKA